MWIPLAVAGAAALIYAWRYASSRSSVFADSDGSPVELESTVELPILQEWSDYDYGDVVDVVVDDQIAPYPRTDEIVDRSPRRFLRLPGEGGRQEAHGGGHRRPALPGRLPGEGGRQEAHGGGHRRLALPGRLQEIQGRIRRAMPTHLGIIKIMTYNIWCLERIEIIERMNAIGKLIQKHEPDIILLQEVVPKIYEIFQNCDWWGLYECSVSPKKARKKYYCMLLSKLPMKTSYYKHFEDTTTRKGLYVAKIQTRANKKLVVATCHLKRPTPPEMNSAERLSQANEALRSLQAAPNAILGGDMNWDDTSDGPFPLPGKWGDAWSILRPEQDGWTYDTKSNEMLRHRRQALQKRLDRFICKLKDFEMVGIDMVGTEAIPNVTYRSKGKRLPVLPSDHYGLILQVVPKQ